MRLTQIHLATLGSAIVMLGGCVSQSSLLTNETGQTVTCAHAGFGWLGAPLALAAQSNCKSNAEAAGFKEIPTGPIAGRTTVAPTSMISANANAPALAAAGTKSTAAITGRSRATIDLPGGWAVRPLTEAQVRIGVTVLAANTDIESNLMLNAVDKSHMNDLQAYALAIQADQAKRLTSPVLSVATKVDVAGRPAYMLHVIGTPPGAQLTRYDLTVIDGVTEVVFLNVWAPEQSYGANRRHFEDLIGRIRGLDSLTG